MADQTAAKPTRRTISGGSPHEDQAGYSRAVVDGRWCFVAGTTGPDPVTGRMPSDIAAQTRNALTIIETALDQAGFALTDVVRARYYLTSRNDVAGVMAILGEVFARTRPAATMTICELI